MGASCYFSWLPGESSKPGGEEHLLKSFPAELNFSAAASERGNETNLPSGLASQVTWEEVIEGVERDCTMVVRGEALSANERSSAKKGSEAV